MRRAGALAAWLGVAGLLTATGCPGDPQEKGPAVDTVWARRARAVRSEATPADQGGRVRATWGPPDERDEGALTALDGGDEDPGDVVVDLGPGTWVLDARVLIRGGAVRVTGAGSHRTRLELQTETSGALVSVGARRFELRGLTVVAIHAGGIGVKGCSDVRVDDVVFAAMRYGLDLDASTARIASSSFIGCEKGLSLDGGAAVTVRESAFVDCWAGLDGEGKVALESCAFTDNRDAISMRLDRGASLVGCLFAGVDQQLGWHGRPRVSRGCLVPDAALHTDADREENRPILHVEEFPDALRQGAPPAMDLVAVHLALERARTRGEKDPPGALRRLRDDRAERHAEAARKALRGGDVRRAREEARVALRYWGDRPLTGDGCPEALVEVADLVR